MTKRVLITTGNGMFGKAVAEQLLGRQDLAVRAMVRDRSAFTLRADNLEVVVGDLDDPATLVEPMRDVTHVFLTTPMDERLEARESAVVAAAVAAAQPHIVAVYGAVHHDDDVLQRQHAGALEQLQNSGLPWTLVSPNSVMETSLKPFAEQLPMGVVLGMSGHGLVGLVSVADCARASAAVLSGTGHEGRNYELTGPEAVDMPYVVAIFARQLDRAIDYFDLPEGEFAKVLLDHGGYASREELEIQVVCHLRAWREGRAETVTDTVRQLTGRPAASVGEWVRDHLADFDARPTMSDRMAGLWLRTQYRKYRMAGSHRYEGDK